MSYRNCKTSKFQKNERTNERVLHLVRLREGTVSTSKGGKYCSWRYTEVSTGDEFLAGLVWRGCFRVSFCYTFTHYGLETGETDRHLRRNLTNISPYCLGMSILYQTVLIPLRSFVGIHTIKNYIRTYWSILSWLFQRKFLNALKVNFYNTHMNRFRSQNPGISYPKKKKNTNDAPTKLAPMPQSATLTAVDITHPCIITPHSKVSSYFAQFSQ